MSATCPPPFSEPTRPFVFLLWGLQCSTVNSSDGEDHFLPPATLRILLKVSEMDLITDTRDRDAFFYKSLLAYICISGHTCPFCRWLQHSLLCGAVLHRTRLSHPSDHMVLLLLVTCLFPSWACKYFEGNDCHLLNLVPSLIHEKVRNKPWSVWWTNGHMHIQLVVPFCTLDGRLNLFPVCRRPFLEFPSP